MKFPSLTSALIALAFGALPTFASSVRGASENARKEVVVKYGRGVETDYVFDALEEADARFSERLSCVRGFLVHVDEEGLKILEEKEGIEVTVSPHRKPTDAERKLVGDDGFAGALFGKNKERKTQECTYQCQGLDNRYWVTEEQIQIIKDIIYKNITTGVEYDCPFRFSRRSRNPNELLCEDRSDTLGQGTVPLYPSKVGTEGFEGELGDSGGALVRMVFHDCGTFNINGNINLSGCNGCADLMFNKNRGLESVTAYLRNLKQQLHDEYDIKITMADLVVVGSTVAIETMIDRAEEDVRYDALHDGEVVPDWGFYRQHLDIPLKIGREDIPVNPDGSCDCEGGDLPTPEPKTEGGCFAIEQIMEEMCRPWDMSFLECMRLMGVHAIGKLKEEFSGYQGCWQFGGDCDTFSNVFYDDATNDRLRKTMNARTFIDVFGEPTDVTVTEWRRGGGGPFPFIFLNSDIVFEYDLCARDAADTMYCNTTEVRDPEFDVLCPRLTDDVALEFNDFGQDGGTERWLPLFSVVYRKMTNTLIAPGCGREGLFDPLVAEPMYMDCPPGRNWLKRTEARQCTRRERRTGKPCLCRDWL